MQFTVLACDYDGTLAPDGTIGQQTIDSLRRCARLRPKIGDGHRPGVAGIAGSVLDSGVV